MFLVSSGYLDTSDTFFVISTLGAPLYLTAGTGSPLYLYHPVHIRKGIRWCQYPTIRRDDAHLGRRIPKTRGIRGVSGIRRPAARVSHDPPRLIPTGETFAC